MTAEPLDLDDVLADMRDCVRVERYSSAVRVPVAHLAAVTAEVTRLRAALATRRTCCDPTTVTERIDEHHLVEEHQHCTCGAGPGSGAGHEPGCGLVPLVDLRGLPGWDALVATARRDALTEAADSVDDAGRYWFGTNDRQWLRARAAQEEGR